MSDCQCLVFSGTYYVIMLFSTCSIPECTILECSIALYKCVILRFCMITDTIICAVLIADFGLCLHEHSVTGYGPRTAILIEESLNCAILVTTARTDDGRIEDCDNHSPERLELSYLESPVSDGPDEGWAMEHCEWFRMSA